ncbi:YhgE/Pip domain-containing protein [Virgibacillus doumboii]|uniref:YhgE/Pip domain-containing protein n=1 Tax=Virgibacillus doumboii TaxID=2697503 RepID=UPI0013E0E6F3|nr:YhgE/Pip domain-containing protein [Virgibacillus doumboii]
MRIKKLAIVMMSAVLVFGSLPLNALAEDNNGDETEAGKYSAKDEAIYGNLDASGALENMYVVNTFHVTDPGKIIDHGNYSDVRNLSNLKDIQKDGNTIRFQAEKGEFYYQGDMNNQPLPWNIDITYMLDGKKIAPEELAGKSGALELQIATSANEDVDPAFFKNYMLQISLTMDPATFNDIQAPDAIKASAGKDTQVTFTVMPEKEETFIVSASVTDIEMNPINITATPASMPIEDPNLGGMKGEMQSLSDAIHEINQGVGDLSSGISELNEGAADLNNGSSDYLNGIKELDQSSGKLVNGSADIRDALNKMSESMQGNSGSMDLSGLKKLPDGLRGMAEGLRKSADGLDTLSKNYGAAYTELSKAMNGIPDYNITDEQIKALRESDANQKVVKQLVDTYQAARNAKGIYQSMEIQKALGSVTGTLDQISGNLGKMADNAETMAAEVEKGLAGMDQMDAIKDLQKGLSSLASEYKTFHSGLVDYTDGVGKLASSYQELDSGIQELSDGVSSLDSGASELKNGTQELQEETSDLPGQMQSEVDEMMDEYDTSDFEPKSFVSDKNSKVGVVQFVLKTEPIEVEETETTQEETDEEKEKGFWGRLLDLFR